jgi:hypothetical protein
MSDGPHRSLPMRRGWKRVAECGDNRAFASEEISRAMIPALEQDCRSEIAPEFLDAISDVFRNQQPSLFKNPLAPQLAVLRPNAGYGIGRVLLEHAIQVAERGGTGAEGLVEATTNALTDRAARGARQVEEHYCRESTSPRAQKVRERIEDAIGGAGITGLARQVLKLDPRPSSPASLKQQGLDDGVRL